MIEIDEENKKIFFYFSPEEIKKNSKRTDEMHEFELISCHKCPECNKIIDAYYIGTLPLENSSNEFYCHPYLHSNASYNRYEPHYKYGHEYGGGYLIMCNHNDTLCKIQINPEQETENTFQIKDICNKRTPIMAINTKEAV